MKSYDELTLCDDFMFSKVMKNEELCKELVELLLDVKVGKIEYFNQEQEIDEDRISRGVRLDVYLKDSNRVFDIEMQTRNRNDLPQRARYYQAMMDIDNLEKGTLFTELKESYIILICTFDPFDREQPKYVFREREENIDNLYLGDKTWKVFYNANAYSKVKNTRIQSFLRYLATQNAESDFTLKLEKAVDIAKRHERWRKDYMTLAMKYDEFREDGLEEGRKEGRKEGRIEGIEIGEKQGSLRKALETAKKMIEKQFDLTEIVELTGLSLEQINEIK